MRTASVAAAAMVLVAGAACDPCAGTPSCRTTPELSYTGQFIMRPSGAPVPGVAVMFVRTAGAALVSDTIRATSGDEGFFTLRTGALHAGGITGDLHVAPPGQTGYVVRQLSLHATDRRGDGGLLGRLFVNPWLQFIGELHDRKTGIPVPNASVTVRALGPAQVTPATASTVAAENGRFGWEPSVVLYDQLVVEFEVSAAGYPRAYVFIDTIPLQFRDEPPRFMVLKVGGGWSYGGNALRRGTNVALSGTVVEWVRTSGIMTSPPGFTSTPNQFGTFAVPIEPIGDGTAVGRLTITPPPPLTPEVIEGVALTTFDGGKTRLFGPFRYGPGAIARPRFLLRATGGPVPEGTWGRFTHVGGLANIEPAPWTVPDNGIRIADTAGIIGYDAATLDTGVVVYDVDVLLNPPHAHETVRMSIPARRSDDPATPTFRVGSWFPWTGTLRDGDTQTPVAGAVVEFRRTAGATVTPESYTSASAATGDFPLQPVPVTTGAVTGQVTVRAPAFRDTTFTVTLAPSQDDTLRSIGVIRLRRAP